MPPCADSVGGCRLARIDDLKAISCEPEERRGCSHARIISYSSHQHEIVICFQAFEANQGQPGRYPEADDKQTDSQETESLGSERGHDERRDESEDKARRNKDRGELFNESAVLTMAGKP